MAEKTKERKKYVKEKRKNKKEIKTFSFHITETTLSSTRNQSPIDNC
jgi:hypothetical protein